MSRNSRIRMKNRVALGMEILEKRFLLAVEWAIIPAAFPHEGLALYMYAVNDRPYANDPDETILIGDYGTSGANNVVVNMNGGEWQAFSHITEILVRTDSGNDTIRYRLHGDLRAVRIVDVEMGAGEDHFTMNFGSLYTTGVGGDLLDGSNLNLRVRGGPGMDEIRVNADRDVDIRAAARFYATLGGDDGMDVIDFLYRGELDGTLELVASGDAHNDTVRAWLVLDGGSMGTVGNPLRPARVRGGTEDDTLTFMVQNNGRAIVWAQIMGDGGADDFLFTNNVDVVW